MFDVAFTASEDKTVRVWSTKNGQLLQTIALESSVWQVLHNIHMNNVDNIILNDNIRWLRLRITE